MASVVIALIIHETGHLIAVIFLGIKFRRIKITLFGFNINVDLEELSFVKKFILFFSGPLFNLLMCFASAERGYVEFADINRFLFCANLMPVMPLDGGNICKSVLEAFLDKERVCRYMLFTNMFFIACFAASAVVFRGYVYIVLIVMALSGMREEKKLMLERDIRRSFYKNFSRKRYR